MNGAQNEQQQGIYTEAQDHQRAQVPPGPTPVFNRKSPVLATLLSMMPGLGQVYVNLKGREKQGIVSEAEYSDLLEEVRQCLLRLRDPADGAKVILSVARGDEIYYGDETAGMPDLVVGFAPGYRVSWQTCLGGMPKGVVVDNKRRWSGDHCSLDPAHTKGTLLCNRALYVKEASILDIAPTVLKYLEVEVPENMDGKPLF